MWLSVRSVPVKVLVTSVVGVRLREAVSVGELPRVDEISRNVNVGGGVTVQESVTDQVCVDVGELSVCDSVRVSSTVVD